MRALDSLAQQTYPRERFEILVMDNGCQDETRHACRELGERLPNLLYLLNPTPGLHSCRHLGLRQARGEIVTFGDDDIRAFPAWLEGVNEAFADPLVGLVGGKVLPEYEVPPPAWVDRLWRWQEGGRVLGAYSLVDMGDHPREVPPGVVFGCNYSVRRDLAVELGGFNPDGFPRELIKYRGNGEVALGRNIRERGHKIFYHPGASVYHFVSADRLTREYLAWRRFIEGISNSYTDIRRAGKLSASDLLSMWIKYLLGLVMNFHDPLALRCLRSYHRGYLYHRSQVRRDPFLQDWVLKPNYWEGNFIAQGNVNWTPF